MTHQEAWNQIPWLVNDTLDEPARERLQRHLAECSACRNELQVQRALLQAINAGSRVEAMPPASLQKLWNRIDAATPPGLAEPRGSVQSAVVSEEAAPAPPPRLRLAAVAATVALVTGAALMALFQPLGGSDPAYRTVSDGSDVAAGDLRVVLAPDMTVGHLQALLDRADARIVAGPTASGVYTLALRTSNADATAVLALLRAEAGVRFAEPVGQ